MTVAAQRVAGVNERMARGSGSRSTEIWPYAAIGGVVAGCGLGAYLVWRWRKRNLKKLAADADENEDRITKESVAESTPRSTTTDGELPFDWTQTLDEVVVEFPVESHVKSRDVRCKFNTRTISVSVGSKELLQGDLFQAMHPDDCVWELAGSGSSRVLILTLVKDPLHLVYWKTILKAPVENGKHG